MWDMLYQRYSNPTVLLNQFIETGRLDEFVLEFIDIRNQEMKEKVQWEFYLHRVHDMTWDEFTNINEQPEEQEADMDKVEAQVKASIGILENFRVN